MQEARDSVVLGRIERDAKERENAIEMLWGDND
jgi:hypothetical protein